MAFGEGGFRTRAASLLPPSLRAASQPHEDEAKSEKHLVIPPSPQAELYMSEKPPLDEPTNDRNTSLSLSSTEKIYGPRGNPTIAHDVDANRAVRTIPTWVKSLTEDDEDAVPITRLLPLSPPSAQLAQHNSSPSVRNKTKSEPARGRLHDLQREWEPPTPRGPVSEHASNWRAFVNASAYPAVSANGRKLVTEEWLVENGPDYSRPWLAGSDRDHAENEGARLFMFQTKRKGRLERLQRTILRSPMIPLVIRTIVWIFSLAALALGSSIRRLTSDNKGPTEKINGPSPNIAIIVDAIALVYILYITYDEYTGKPLGLRSARAKMRLIFLDLFFIVFDSANLSLAFEAVSHSEQECTTHKLGHTLCHQQQALASVLLIALISWLLTFSISVLRLVERVTGK